MTDEKGTQSMCSGLEKLAAGLPPGEGSCQKRLPAVEKQVKASR